MASGSNMALEGCRQTGDSSEKSSSNKEPFRIDDERWKKMAHEFLSQKGSLVFLLVKNERLKGNILVFRGINSCFKGRSSSSFFSIPSMGRIEVVSFSYSKGRFGCSLKKCNVSGRQMSVKDHESPEGDFLVSFQSSSSERAAQ